MKNLTTILDITGSHIKLLQAKSQRGTGRVRTFGVRPVRPERDEVLADALKSLAAEHRVKAGPVTVVIPRRYAMLRMVSLPSHAGQELDKMVKLQVTRQGPYAPEDITFDYTVLRRDPSGYAGVLVIIVHKDIIQRYIDIAGRAGMSVGHLTLSSSGVAGWFGYYLRKSRQKQAQPVAVVDIDSDSSEIVFCREGQLLFSRSIDFGARDLMAERMTDFVDQIKLTMAAYTKENLGEDLAKILVCSPLPKAALLCDALSESYQGMVESLNPYDFIDMPRALKNRPDIHEQGLSAVVPFGLSLLSEKQLINLLPEEVTDKRRVSRMKKKWMAFAGLLIILFGAVAGVMGARVFQRRQYLRALEMKTEALEPRVRQVTAHMERLRVIDRQLVRGHLVMDIIREVHRIMPESISLNQLYLGADRSVSLKGLAGVAADVNDLQSRLVASGMFENVSLQYATKRRIFQGEVTDFKINCTVAGEPPQ